MKKGVAGVRLCDVSGCYVPWPCQLHGTRTSVPLLYSRTEVRSCQGCGYALCNCSRIAVSSPEAPLWEPPEGWKYVPATRFLREFYANDAIPAPYGYVFRGYGGWACNADLYLSETPSEAIRRAECLYRGDRHLEDAKAPCPPTPPPEEPPKPLPAYLEPLRQALARIRGDEGDGELLRRGWHHVPASENLHEAYLNDGLPLGFDCVYRIAGGWTFGKCSESYISPHRAMLEAEERAGECDD
jgi:hypothetical protein